MENSNNILIKKIIDISRKIYTINNNIFNLETNNQTNTLEYQKQNKYLEICLEIESELYEQIDFLKIHEYLEYIDQDKLFRTYQDFDILLNPNQELLIKKRIYNRLNSINYSNLISIYQKDNHSKNDEPAFDHTIFLRNSIHDDIEKLLVYLALNEAIQEENINYKNELLKIKFYLTFLNQNIYYYFKNFSHTKLLFLNSRTITDLFGIDNYYYQLILKKYFLKIIKVYINDLLNIKDLDYLDNNLRIRIDEIIIKSFLILNENQDINSLIYDIIKKNNKNKTSVSILKNLLTNINNLENIEILRSERLILNGNSK